MRVPSVHTGNKEHSSEWAGLRGMLRQLGRSIGFAEKGVHVVGLVDSVEGQKISVNS